jgi:NADH-quinone oxidoreductase subunit G
MDRDAAVDTVVRAAGDAKRVGLIADERNREHAAEVAAALARDHDVQRMTVTRGVNGRGAKDLGVLPNLSVGYGSAPSGGKHGREILEAAASGALHALLLLGPNPALEEAAELLDRATARADAVIVIETRPSALTKHATVLIPGHAFLEKTGTVTNLEGRVQRIRPALPPATQAPAETRVLTAIAGELGALGWDRGDAIAVNRAMREALPAYAAAGVGGRAAWAVEARA